MHAYAADDPVFVAMNARGQRETKGALGSFCVQCHAPVALATGATTDGLNLGDLPASQKGVTCYFCHSADDVTGTHNAPVHLASDGVMRGGIADPIHNIAHKSGHSKLHDRGSHDSASLCGSCHDIDSPHGAHLERTYAEWQGTIFSHGASELTCGQCHMDGRKGPAAQVDGAPSRTVHDHGFPGVDVALTPWPDSDLQRARVQASLDTTLHAALCVKGANFPGATQIQVVLDNVGAGHAWPSGATQDRRAWVEVVAYAKDQVVYESGAIADDASIVAHQDSDLWLLRDCMFDEQKKPVPMFWQAYSVAENALPCPVTNVPSNPDYYLTHVVRTYPRESSMPPTLATPPDKVTMRVRFIPIGLDLLEDLVASKDLDPSIVARMKPFTLASTNLTWTDATATIKYGDQGLPVSCVAAGLTTGANTATPAPDPPQCGP